MTARLPPAVPTPIPPAAATRVVAEPSLRARVAPWVLAALLTIVPGVTWYWSVHMPSRSFRGELPAATLAQQALAALLRTHVERLAGEIGDRNTERPEALDEAADWLEAELRGLGYTPLRQSFDVRGTRCHNIESELTGGERASEIVIAGAHYDSVAGTVGANDNASGVAALLALARTLKAGPVLSRSLRFVWFTNEEPPHFQGPDMGSARYASRAAQRGERIAAMLSLETMGFYTDAPDTQRYPAPLSLLYPSTGNFIGFVGNLQSRALVRRALGSFRRAAQFPSEGAALPASLPGVGWSDHWAFWQHGYPAIMVTDTAPFRYPHYHTHRDTPDKLDYVRLARVTEGLATVLSDLANGD